MNSCLRRFIKQPFATLAAIPLCMLGMAEAAVGAIQWMGILSSHHNDYPFTGTFYNPGPYACYLAVLLPMAVFACKNTGHILISRMVRWLATGMALSCAILIPASLSRTAMIAAAIGTAIAYRDELKAFLHKNKAMCVIGMLIAVLTIAGGMYAVKKDSADGRLVMWKVAMQAAADTPLTGMGWDNVAGAYGEAQERYFGAGRGSEEEMMVADAPKYVFNEYLQVGITFGPLALLGMVVLMAGAFTVAFRSKDYGTAGSVAATSLVMAASYPLQFPLFTITIVLILLAAWLSSSHFTVKMTGSALTITASVLLLTHTPKTDVEAAFACGLSLHRSRDYIRSNEILIPLLEKSSDPMILNIIGKNYQSIEMPDSAEYWLSKSTLRCPNRMYPHYLLMLLYADSASYDRCKCLKEANTILTMPVKIPSPAVDEMREKAVVIKNNQAALHKS